MPDVQQSVCVCSEPQFRWWTSEQTDVYFSSDGAELGWWELIGMDAVAVLLRARLGYQRILDATLPYGKSRHINNLFGTRCVIMVWIKREDIFFFRLVEHLVNGITLRLFFIQCYCEISPVLIISSESWLAVQFGAHCFLCCHFILHL